MAIKISELGNLSSWSDSTYIPVVSTSGALTTVKSTAGNLKTYVLGNILTDISTLYSNATAQATSIFQAVTSVTVANLGMKGYVDNGITSANVGMIGYVDNKATLANTAIVGFIGLGNTIQSQQISAANVGIVGFIGLGNTIQSQQISAANVGMKGYVDSQTFYSNARVATYLQVGGIGNISVAGNVTATYFVGNGALLTGIAASSNYSNINVTAFLPIYSGNIRVSGTAANAAIANGGTAGVGNIGATGQGFNTIFARATTASYADLAEYYIGDHPYTVGTVLEFGGVHEVTMADDETTRVAGIVSTQPAFFMNDALETDASLNEHKVCLALQGRVPCKVTGTIAKGDMLVSAGNGYAKATTTPKFGTIIGKSLEDFSGNVGFIEVVVGRL
jgi:hypothetical protein